MNIFLWAAAIRIIQYFVWILQAEYRKVSAQAA